MATPCCCEEKTSFSSAIVAVGNEGQTHAQAMEASTVYVNPYYITTNYYEQTLASKHYYMGSQRISSEMIAYAFSPDGTTIHEPPAGPEAPEGEGGSTGGSTSTSYSTSEDAIIKSFERTLRCLYDDLEMTFDWSENLNMQSIGGPIQMGDCNLSDPMPHEEAICACEQSIYHANLDGHECNNYNIQYWYHPDYLGSVEFVTDRDGEAYQFFLNTPWGENLESHSSYSYKSFDSRFRFNGKELDPETGNYYYGARYYDPKVSVWLSVDPIQKHHESPYSFTANNPIRFIDPDGRDTSITDSELRATIFNSIENDPEFAERFNEIVESDQMFVFNKVKGRKSSVSTDGNDVEINVARDGMAPNVPMEASLYEEVEHINQLYMESGALSRMMMGPGEQLG